MSIFSPVRMLLLFVVVALLGIFSIPYLHIDLLPQSSNTPGLTIHFQTPKSSPELNEERYTGVLENALSVLTQIKSIQSSSNETGGEITLKFTGKVNVDIKRFEISMILRQIYRQLPEGISYPVIGMASNESKMESEAIKVYMITGPEQSTKIKELTQPLLVKEFYRLPGVKEIELSGTPLLEATIEYDPVKCEAFHISPQQITAAIQEEFKDSYPGLVPDQNGHQLFLKVALGELNPDNLMGLIVQHSADRPIQLKDIASLKIAEQQIKEYYRIDGQNGINVSIYPKAGINTMQLSAAIDQTVAHINRQLPTGYTLKPVYDKTAYLSQELRKNEYRTLLSISILVVFILIAYRSLPATIILLAGLIANLLLATLLAVIFSVNINLYSIGGITLAFSMMVDNAIVMLDYYRKNKDLKIVPALFGATMSIVMAISTIYLLPDAQGGNFKDFAAIIIIALLSSVVVAIGFTPAIAQLLTPYSKAASQKIALHKWNGFIFYQRFLHVLSRHRYKTIFCFILLFAGGLQLFLKNLSDRSGIRNPDQSKLYLTCNMTDGHTAAQMNTLFQSVETWLGQQQGIDKFVTYIENGQYGGIEIFLKKEYGRGKYPSNLKERLIQKCDEMEGVKWHIFGIGLNYDSNTHEDQNTYSILLKGYNYRQLLAQAERLNQKLLENKRVSHVNLNEQYDYRDRKLKTNSFVNDAGQMNHLLLGNASFYVLMQHLTSASEQVAQLNIEQQYYPVYVRSQGWREANEYDFMQSLHQKDSTGVLRLAQMGKLQSQPGSNTLYKKDRQYIRVISYNYLGESSFGVKHQEAIIAALNREMPAGYTASKHAMNFEEESNYKPLGIILLLAAINFVIGCIIFENLLQPFLIICLIPQTFIGLFYTFALGHFAIDQGGYAAFIMLGGLVVNAGIFLINDFNKLRQQQLPVNEAIAKAFYARSRPIILTIISCCCGLVPFVFDGKEEVFWYCFSVGTLGGLSFSFISLFIFLPVMMAQKIKKI